MVEQLNCSVFRVMYFDGVPKVVERELVGRNGSWFTTRDKKGNLHKENGNRWSRTVLGALEQEAVWIMNRHALPTIFRQDEQIRSMYGLLEETFRWGELFGAVNGLRDGERPEAGE